MNINFMKIAMKEAKKSLKHNDVPVGAVLVYDNKLLTKGHNKRSKNSIVIGHAEILVIHKANQKTKRWRLDGCEMYVTLKPCKMCMEVIREAKISKVYYLLEPLDIKKNRYINSTTYEKIDTELSSDCKQMLANFFIEKR